MTVYTGRVPGHVRAVYTCRRPCTVCVQVYTGRIHTRPCRVHDHLHGRVSTVFGPCTRLCIRAVYTGTQPCAGRLQGRVRAVYTTVSTRGGVHTRRPCVLPHGRVQGDVHGRVHGPYVHGLDTLSSTRPVYTWCNGRVHGPYTAVKTACTRRLGTRIHGLYAKPIEFATFSQTVVIRFTSVNKAKHYYCLSPEVY